MISSYVSRPFPRFCVLPSAPRFRFELTGSAQFITTLRTPIAKFKGAYKDTYPEELLAAVLKATRERLEVQGLDIARVQDIAVGTVLMELGGKSCLREESQCQLIIY